MSIEILQDFDEAILEKNKYAGYAFKGPLQWPLRPGERVRVGDNCFLGKFDVKNILSSFQREQMGKFFVEEFERCDTVIYKQNVPDKPTEHLGSDESKLRKALTNIVCVLDIMNFYTGGEYRYFSGMKQGSIESKALEVAKRDKFPLVWPARYFTLGNLKDLNEVALGLESIQHSTKHGRLKSSVNCFLKAITESSWLERVFHCCRALEAVFMLEKNEGEKAFCGKIVALLGDSPDTQSFAKRVYESRSALAHVREIRPNYFPQDQTEVAQAISDVVAQSVVLLSELYSTIFADEDLMCYFESDSSISEFWKTNALETHRKWDSPLLEKVKLKRRNELAELTNMPLT